LTVKEGCVTEDAAIADPSVDPAGALSDLTRKRRKRRSVEIRNSLRLGLLLAGLVGINVYVFFFNRGTAPREVLKPAAMAKSAEGRQQEILAQSARQPTATATAPATATGGGVHRAPVVLGPADKRGTQNKDGLKVSGRAPAAQLRPGGPGGTIQIPFAPPRPLIQIPFAPPEDDAAVADGEDESDAHAGEKKIGASDTLGQVLAREGFGSSAGNVIAALTRLTDPKLIRGGQIYLVRLEDDGTPSLFEYRPTPVLRYLVEKGSDGAWKARKLEQAVDIKTTEVAGVVESSLYESVQRTGESVALVSLLVELFAWDVNFYIDTHPGDHWKVVVEKQYLGGQFYKYGRLLAAEYGGRVGVFRAFYWNPKPSKAAGRYYDEHGQAIAKTMLKTPLRFVRISSKFDRKRFHPILHIEKAHLGIDYAAPVGTPVWASASGRVVEAEMKRGSGNTVVIAHSNGLSTRYYHLSRFARGLRAGQTVRQKDVIGFVGTTGLSTGPHLHFSVTKNGAFVDPGKIQVNRDPAVPERAAFLDAIRPRLAALRNLQTPTLAKN
jgi:murein DD-endopeptidase MepM/ murein hydrolase activator NlpD